MAGPDPRARSGGDPRQPGADPRAQPGPTSRSSARASTCRWRRWGRWPRPASPSSARTASRTSRPSRSAGAPTPSSGTSSATCRAARCRGCSGGCGCCTRSRSDSVLAKLGHNDAGGTGVLVQVNVAGEEGKGGVAPGRARRVHRPLPDPGRRPEHDAAVHREPGGFAPALRPPRRARRRARARAALDGHDARTGRSPSRRGRRSSASAPRFSFRPRPGKGPFSALGLLRGA